MTAYRLQRHVPYVACIRLLVFPVYAMAMTMDCRVVVDVETSHDPHRPPWPITIKVKVNSLPVPGLS